MDFLDKKLSKGMLSNCDCATLDGCQGPLFEILKIPSFIPIRNMFTVENKSKTAFFICIYM